MTKTKYNIEHGIVKSIHTKTELSKEQFKELYTFLYIIKPHFTDLSMINGQFRARSNDRACIVETEFTYFRDIVFNILDINLLVKMLSTLDKKADITIVIDDTKVTFADGYQNVQVMNANLQFIKNKFVTDEEMEKIFIGNIIEDKPFIKETLPKSVVCNINKITRDFKTNSISIKHTETDLNAGYIFISNHKGYGYKSNDNTREFSIKFKEVFLAPLKKDHYFNVSNLPFIFNKADMTFNYYFNNDGLIITIHTTSIDGLLINIYGRASYWSPIPKKNDLNN